MSHPMSRLLSSIMLSLLFVLCGGSSLVEGQNIDKHRYHRYLIPEGYVGWVRVDFNVKEAPPLPTEGGYPTLKIPLSGRLETSSDDDFGVLYEAFYYFSEENQYRLPVKTSEDSCMIWGQFQGPVVTDEVTDRPRKFRYFFVGPEAEYDKYKCGEDKPCLDREEDGYVKAGPRTFLTKEEIKRIIKERP